MHRIFALLMDTVVYIAASSSRKNSGLSRLIVLTSDFDGAWDA
jgi:hypothetical protein